MAPELSVSSSPDNSPSRLQSFLCLCFGPVVKLTALRLAILACIATLATGLMNLNISLTGNLDSQIYIGTVTFSLLHLIVSVFVLPFIPNILDLSLIISELTLLIVERRQLYFDRFSPTSTIVLWVSGWSLVSFLAYLVLSRIENLSGFSPRPKPHDERKALLDRLWQPFSIIDQDQRKERQDIPLDHCPAASSMLFGKSIWLNRFPGESDYIKIARGLFAGMVVASLIGYAVVCLIIEPIRETALIPVVETRGDQVPKGNSYHIEEAVWNFVFVRKFPKNATVDAQNATKFHDAISVTRLIDPSSLNGRNPANLLCEHTPGALQPEPQYVGIVQMIHVHCPPILPPKEIPDMLISLDYSKLGVDLDLQQYDLVTGAPEVFLGLTQRTHYLTHSTKPFPLPAGVNYLASVSLDLRKVLRRRVLSALGMFEATDVFWMPTVEHIVPDPLVRQPSSILPSSVNISTFRLYIPFDPSEIRIIQESREKTVLAGLSAIGGLWTLVAGGFGLFFGTKLLQMFIDNKPLSIFGLAQQHGREEISKEYLTKYPKIPSELWEVKPKDKGMLALLADYMIDVKMLEDTYKKGPPKSTPDLEGRQRV